MHFDYLKTRKSTASSNHFNTKAATTIISKKNVSEPGIAAPIGIILFFLIHTMNDSHILMQQVKIENILI